MSKPIYIQGRKAAGTIAAYTIVKQGSNDYDTLAASAVNDAIIGVSSQIAAVSGDPMDVVRLGPAFVTAGGTITRGDKLTSDASGNAITATDSLKSTVIAGGAAGNLTVTDIKTTDTLVSVIRLDRDATAANINESDLTSEFTISAADTINNTSGTNTTGDALIVLYRRKDKVVGTAEESASSGDVFNAFIQVA